MDLTTVLGLVLGFGLMVLAIVAAGESLWTFSHAAAYVIVFGGAFAAFLVAFPIARVLKMGGVLRKAFIPKKSSPETLIRELVGYAEIARRDGILALEKITPRMHDPFIVRGVQLVVDGTDPDLVE